MAFHYDVLYPLYSGKMYRFYVEFKNELFTNFIFIFVTFLMDLIYFKGVVNSSGNSISRGNPSLHPHHQINNSHQIHYSASQDVYSNSAATPGSAGK